MRELNEFGAGYRQYVRYNGDEFGDERLGRFSFPFQLSSQEAACFLGVISFVSYRGRETDNLITDETNRGGAMWGNQGWTCSHDSLACQASNQVHQSSQASEDVQ